MVDLLLELGADINQKSDWWAGGFGVLDSADANMAAYLISRGVKLTPHAAARLGMIGALRAMLTADPSLVHARGGDGQMPLHLASTPEIAALLLDLGAPIHAKDIDHASTPAEYLATTHPQTAAYVLTRGATPDPFMAVCIGDLPLLERLLASEPQGVNIRISRDRFPAPPPAAGHIYLYTIGEGRTLLHAAAVAGQPDAITLLVARGADSNARGGYDNATPLHAAAWSNRPQTPTSTRSQATCTATSRSAGRLSPALPMSSACCAIAAPRSPVCTARTRPKAPPVRSASSSRAPRSTRGARSPPS
jgi:hypothetical protein